MNSTSENAAASVTRVRIGVATHVTPKFSLVGNEALQDLRQGHLRGAKVLIIKQ